MNQFVNLKRYYVYALIDPRNDEVFYIGKGTDQRAEDHSIQAKNLLKQARKDLQSEVEKKSTKSDKTARIQGIVLSGQSVKVLVIARFDKDEQAFAAEAILIHWHYGLSKLTNIASGKHYKNIIDHSDYEDKLLNLDKGLLEDYYVYQLIDPRSNEVFYVGKGRKVRVNDHEKQASTSEDENKKLDRIRDIRKNNYNVKTQIISFYSKESEAFAVESLLMHWIYGMQNLTNIQRGHDNAYIRNYGNLAPIQGIDIPEEGYNERRLGAIEQYQVLETANKVRASLISKGLAPEHCCLPEPYGSVEDIALKLPLLDVISDQQNWQVILVIQFGTTGEILKFNLIPSNRNKKEFREKFMELFCQIDPGLSEKTPNRHQHIRNGGDFAKLSNNWLSNKNRITPEETNKITSMLREAINYFKNRGLILNEFTPLQPNSNVEAKLKFEC